METQSEIAVNGLRTWWDVGTLSSSRNSVRLKEQRSHHHDTTGVYLSIHLFLTVALLGCVASRPVIG